MMKDFRALCAELADAYLRTLEHINNSTWLGYEPSDDPLLQRARASLADEPPEPAPPTDGEVAEFVEWLQEEADDYECIGCEDSAAKCRRVAELLQRQASPACMVLKPSPELIEALEDGPPGRVEPLLERQVLVPVAVSERPWEREGWCDVEGRFWAEHISRSGVASWRCAAASDLGGWAVRCLPAHALPLPEVGE